MLSWNTCDRCFCGSVPAKEEGGGRLAQQRQVVCGAVCIEGLAVFTELWNEGSCLSLGQRAVILSHPYAVIEWVVLITRLH